MIQSFEKKRLSALGEEDVEELKNSDLLEDSGISQMADLRAQIARLAHSTETLHPKQAQHISAANTTASMNPRSEDTIGNVQRQIERRKLVKAAVERGRQRAHTRAEETSQRAESEEMLNLKTDDGHAKAIVLPPPHFQLHLR